MKIRYTQTKIPYIEFDRNNRIAFSSLTATDEGYSHLIVSGMGQARFSKVKGGKKAKTPEQLQSKERISVISDIKFNGTGVLNKLKKMFIYKYIPTIKEKIGELTENGIFPKKNITKLEKIIANIDENITVEEPKKVVKKRVAKTKIAKKKISKKRKGSIKK